MILVVGHGHDHQFLKLLLLFEQFFDLAQLVIDCLEMCLLTTDHPHQPDHDQPKCHKDHPSLHHNILLSEVLLICANHPFRPHPL
jgi:hypothetical protein